jgi:anti-anti-sigma regulatory factor
MSSETPGISIDESDQPSVVIVRLSDIPVREQKALPKTIDDLIEKGLRLFAVDCAGVAHVNSLAIGSLMGIAARSQKATANRISINRVALVGLERRIESALTIVKLTMIADRCLFCPSLQEALNALRGGDPDDPPPAGGRVPRPETPPTRDGGAELHPPDDAS